MDYSGDARAILKNTALAVAQRQLEQQESLEKLTQLKEEIKAVEHDLLPDLRRRIINLEEELVVLTKEVDHSETLLDKAIDNLIRNSQ